MTAVQITPRAAADLEAIANWTMQAWGAVQMETYMRRLQKRLDWLAENPGLGRDRAEFGSGFRSFPEGRHLIFYRVQGDLLAVLAVVHQSMDVTNQLGPA